MGRNFYHFDPKKLSYIKSNAGFKNKFLTVLTFLSILLISAILLNLVLSSFFIMPEEKALIRETKRLNKEYKKLNTRFEEAGVVLKNIKQIDSVIYKSIFETEPDFNALANEGFQEAERYEQLSFSNNATVIDKTRNKLDELKNMINIHDSLSGNILSMLTEDKDLISSIPSIQPVSNNNLTRTAAGWGWKIHPIYKIKKFHYGIDFTAAPGSKVVATANGKVEKIFTNSHTRDGKKIILSHKYGYKTVYCHLDRFNVRKGQEVKRGEIIGYVGSTGLSTAPHLHYEVIKNGEQVDPVFYFFGELSPHKHKKLKTIASATGQSFD